MDRNGSTSGLSSTPMPTVLIVDDEPSYRSLVRIHIETGDHDLQIVGEATSGEEAITLCRDLKPDVILMDNRMPGIGGIEAARKILSETPQQRIVLFSAYLDPDVISAAQEAGVQEIASKGDMRRVTRILAKN